MTRRKISESEKKLKGTYRADREKPKADAPGDLSGLAPPDHIQGEVRDIWLMALATAPDQILRPCDIGTFEVWCNAYAQYREATAKLAEQDTVIRLPTGYQQPNQWFSIQQKCAATMATASKALGFEPAARNRMDVSQISKDREEAEKSEWFWFIVNNYHKDSSLRVGMFERLGLTDIYPECKAKRWPADEADRVK